MAKSRKNAKKSTNAPGGVVRRPAAERKRLPPELEAFARSEDMRLRSGAPPRPRLRDPRPTALVPGVANRDARAVHDRRVDGLREALARRPAPEAEEALARGLADAVRMGLWRGRSVTSFEAFAQDLLGLDPEEARALAARGAEAQGVPCDRCSEEAVAAWLRTEAGLLEEGQAGEVTVAPGAEGEVLRLELPIGGAPAGIMAVGRRMAPLARDQEEVARRAAQRAEEKARRDAKKRGGRRED